jgi:ectoine hydroxylase-related dioxygenase (phytanoyl-CoA dioxygenase family)
MSYVDSQAVADYALNGAVVIRGCFTPDQVDLVRAGVARNLAEPGPLVAVASEESDTGRFVEDFCNWQRIPEYEEFIRTSPAARIARELMESEHVRLYHDHLLVKEAKTRQRTLDPVPRESTLEFVAGSHLGPWLMPRTFRDEQAKWFPEGTLGELPRIDDDRDAYPILGWPLEPGDAVWFHMLTLHGAAGSQSLRRAFSLRFLGDDMVHAPRAWRTSPEFAGLADELPAGVPMDHPLFPVLV